MSNEATKELEGHIGSSSQAPDNQRVAMPTARASDLPLLIVSGANSPRSRIGRGLESIGGMTAETLQRLSTAVGGVVKSPVVLMAKVGGLASPRAATLTAPPGSSLEERVSYLETQIKSFEERFNSRTIMRELDLSPCLHKEKPRIAKSLVQEMEMEETLVKRVHMLEDCVNERMKKIEKALSSVQSQLDPIKFSRHENMAGYERLESLSNELRSYNAEQHSDSFEALEGVKENSFGAHDVPNEAIGGSPLFEKSHVKETSIATPTTPKHVEPLQEIDVGKNDDFLDPQVVSPPVYSKEAFLTEPMKSVVPSGDHVKCAHRNDVGNSIASLDRQLASQLEELHGSYVTKSLAAATSAKFLEIARAITVEKSTLAHASLEPQSSSVFEEPQEAFPREPSTTTLVAESEEHAQEQIADKCGPTITAMELLLPPTFEASEEDFTKEPLPVAPNANLAQELATQGVVIISLPSSETPMTSIFVEEPLMVVPNANSKEPTHKDTSDKNVNMIAIGESPKAFAFQDPQEDFVTKALVGAPSAGLVHEPSSQEDLSTANDMALASFESPMASKSVGEPSATTSSANFQEFAQENVVDKNGNTSAAKELPLVSSMEEFEEEFVKKFMATAPSADLEEVVQEDVAKKIGTTMAAKELPMASSFKKLQEDFEKESLAIAPSVGPIHEPSSQEDSGASIGKALASFEPQVASKFVDEPLSFVSNANFKEPAQDKDVVNSDTVSAGANSPLAPFCEESQGDFEKEALVATLSHKFAKGLAMEEKSHMAPTSSESQEASKFVEEPSTIIPSANFEELVHEDAVDKSVAMIVDGVSPFTSSFEGPLEDYEKEAIASIPSIKLVQELVTQEDSDMAPCEPQVASKFVEEPSTTSVPSANVESPLVSSLEDYTKDSLALGAIAKVLEPKKEDKSRKSPIALAPLEAPLASLSRIPHEEFSKNPSETSVQLEEIEQEKSRIMLSDAGPMLTSKMEEGNHATKENEYKLANDFKVHHEHIRSIEKEFPRSQSNLAHVGFDKMKLEGLATEDSDDHLESNESDAEFFDAEHGSGNLKPLEFDEPKSFEEFNVGLGDARGSHVVAEKAALVLASSVEPAQEPKQAPTRELAQELGQAYESSEQAFIQEPKHSQDELEQQTAQEHGQELTQQHAQELEQQPAQQPTQESEQEDLTRKSAMALPASESQVTSTSGESHELLIEEFLAAISSTKFEEPAQVNTTNENGTYDLALTSTTEEPHIDTIVSLERSMLSASFCQNENLEFLKNLEQKLLDIVDTSSTHQEALGSEPLIAASTTEIAQGHDSEKSDNIHILLEPQLEESKEALANETMKAVPSTKSVEPIQEVGDGQSGAILASSKPQLTPTLQEPNEGFVKEPLVHAKSAPKAIHLEDSLADKPLAGTSAKLAQENIADKISNELVEELPLTSIAEEPQGGSVNSLGEGKHGQDEVDQKFLEDVKMTIEPIKEAIPRTQSDLTHAKLNIEPIEDAPELQSQGSFLALGAISVDSKEAKLQETLPSAKLLELFEEENNNGKKDHVLTDSPVTSTVEEPQQVLPEERLATAKLVPKGHARRKGFARSSSEPQFASKLEEHQKALVKESSVVVVPSTSRLGEEHAQEDFANTHYLPFRIFGKGKHPRKESNSKLVEDVKSPTPKFETTSSPYVLEPKPSKIKEIKEKKKKEKKEKKPSATVEEKEKRLLLGSGEMERRGSLRAEEKHKQHFKHLRDRLRHAFSINKEP